MSATNSTTHYNLPSFVGSDKPAWLVDWNGAMAAIDSAIYEAKSTADQAVTAAAAVASDLATLSGTVTTQGASITTLSETLTTAVGNINTINGNITTINSLIGNGTPTTTDQTLIGAINEINAQISKVTKTVTADGVKTWSEILDEFFGELNGNTHNEIKLEVITANSTSFFNIDSINTQNNFYLFARPQATSNAIITIKQTASTFVDHKFDETDTAYSSNVVASGTKFVLYA